VRNKMDMQVIRTRYIAIKPEGWSVIHWTKVLIDT
jgi:hypothetical protein